MKGKNLKLKITLHIFKQKKSNLRLKHHKKVFLILTYSNTLCNGKNAHSKHKCGNYKSRGPI